MTADNKPGDSPFGAFARRPVAKGGSKEAVASKARPDDPDAASRQPAPASVDIGQTPDDLVEIGYIGQAYGVKGQVKVFPHAEVGHGGDALLAAKYWWVANGRPRVLQRIKVLSSRVHSGAIAAALHGIDGRDAAEAMKGATVSVRRSDFPRLDAGEYYWVDLIGLDVSNPAGVALGKVSDLMDNGAHSVLRVAYESVDAAGKPMQGERLIPFVDAYLREVDLTGKKIIVDWDVDY